MEFDHMTPNIIQMFKIKGWKVKVAAWYNDSDKLLNRQKLSRELFDFVQFGTVFHHMTPEVLQTFKVKSLKWSKVKVAARKHCLIAKLLFSFRKLGLLNLMAIHNFDQKPGNSSLCACAVPIWQQPRMTGTKSGSLQLHCVSNCHLF